MINKINGYIIIQMLSITIAARNVISGWQGSAFDFINDGQS